MSLPLPIGALASLCYFLTLFAAGYRVSGILLREARPAIRLFGAMCSAWLVHSTLIHATLYTGNFRWFAILVPCLVLAAATFVAYRNSPVRALLNDDIASICEAWGDIATGRFRWALYPILAMGTALFLRELIAPPLDWDSLTYHLTKPALWIQTGENAVYGAQGSIQVYRYFPPAGDGISAIVLMFGKSDALIPAVWGAVWVLMMSAVVVSARYLSDDPVSTTMAGIAAGLIPAFQAHAFVAYVDNLVALFVLTGMAAMLEFARTRDHWTGVLALVSLVCAVSVKPTAGPFLAGGGLMWVALARTSARPWRQLAIAAGVGAVIVLPPYLDTWSQTGNPLYPFHINVGDWVIFQGDPDVDLPKGHARFVRSIYWKRAFYEGYHSYFNHVNLGPGGGLLAVAGLIGVIRSRGDVRARIVGGFAVLSMICFFYLFNSTTKSGLNLVRYIGGLCSIGAAVVLLPPKPRYAVLGIATAIGMIYFSPHRWAAIDYEAVVVLLISLLPIALVGGIFMFAANKYERPILRYAALSCVIVGLTVVLPDIRAIYRNPIYTAFTNRDAYSNFPAGGNFVSLAFHSAGIWEVLETEKKPSKVAIAAGWDTHGHNWVSYPLFGSDLRHEVVYVPVTKSGEIIPRRNLPEHLDEISFSSWHQRLLDEQIDYLVVYAPETAEFRFVVEHPEWFEPVARNVIRIGRSQFVNVLVRVLHERNEAPHYPIGVPAQGDWY